MNIGLIDVDGHNYPNLALMKISAYHKSIGDNVTWYDIFDEYGIVYKAKVFTFTPDYQLVITNAKKIIQGGTGYDTSTVLEHDHIQPDYNLYSNTSWYKPENAYGFLTRGCPNKCAWCIVPDKEGNVSKYMDIEEIAQDKTNIILMDNNVLASDWGLSQIEKSIKLGFKIDFNQGLDARLICNDIEVVKLLSKVKWFKPLRMACDSSGMKGPIKKAAELLRKYNCTPKRYFIYVLFQELQDSYERVLFCKDLKLVVYGQPYRDFTPNQIIAQWQLDMARYTNHKALFEAVDFKDYEPRVGFKCSEYFK